MKLGIITCTGHVACMGEMNKFYSILINIPLGKKALWIPGRGKGSRSKDITRSSGKN
jgi:hypothetical protein